MALRVFLLGLVALMSLELPTGQQVQSWTENGSRWLSVRMNDVCQFGTEFKRAWSDQESSVPTPGTSTPADPLVDEIALMRSDLAFEMAMNGLIADFRTDLAATEAKLPVASEAPALAIVERLPSESVVEATEPACFDHEMAVEEIESARSTGLVETASIENRLGSAVRLTRQALSAWASFLPIPDSEPETDREATR